MTLTAVPLAGYVFDDWSGQTDGIDDPHQNPVTFPMGDRTDNNRVITANFASSDVRCIVTTATEPGGGGSVKFQPEQPPGGYLVNEIVTVRAVEETGYLFSRWTGDLAGNDNPRTLLVSKDKSLAAIFNPTVTVYCSPYDAGSVALEPPQSINGYVIATEVAISAKAGKGYRFVGWEGDASGSGKSITITVDEPKTITATFVGQAPSRWWLWVIVGLVGLFAALMLVRLAYARMNRGALDEPQQPDE